MPPREQLVWNLALQHLLAGVADDAAVTAIFERLAANAVSHTNHCERPESPSLATIA